MGVNSPDRFSLRKGYRARTLFLLFDYCFLAALMVIMVLPLLKVLVDSIDPTSYGVRLWPREVSFAAYEMIIQNSTAPATRPGSKADDGLELLELPKADLPDMCSLDCSLITTTWGELSFIYEWTRPWLTKAAKRMMELGIKPELEAFRIFSAPYIPPACWPTPLTSPSSWA